MKKLVVSFVVALLTIGIATTSVSAEEYEVKQGDSLWKIANTYNTTVDELIKINDLSNTIIYPKQSLNVDEKEEKKSEKAKETNTEASTEKSDDNAGVSDKTPKGETISVSATAYTASCDGCSGVTAMGVDLNADPNAKVIAVDPDVIPLGSEVYVEGYGHATAADTGGAINGNKIDLHVPSKDEALDWGVQSVDVTVIE